jgi:hypothetical protein
MVIRILDHVKAPSTYEDGDVIFRLIVGDLKAGREVSVSFDGVLSVPSAFINGAFIRLLESIPFDVVRSKLRFEHSTRHINELLRSRFEFVAAGGATSTVKEGLYHVDFISGNRSTGQGTVVIKGTTVNGGDTGFVFSGRIYGTDEKLTADLHVTRWNAGHVSVFGNLPEFHLSLSGKASAAKGTFSVSGSVKGRPGLNIAIEGRYLSPAA